MRKFVIVATLSFFLVSCERNYIKNLQIEGISLGDSALDFFDENQIKDNEWDYYKNKYYTPVQLERMPFFKTYDAVDFSYKTGDGNYKIHDLTGVIYFDNISLCYKKMDELYEDFQSILLGASISEKLIRHDPSGVGDKKTFYEFNYGDFLVHLSCYDYVDEIDILAVEIRTKDFDKWILEEAYFEVS